MSDATEDDGSCEYAADGYDCEGNEVCNYASVDYLGLTGSNESDGIYYLDFESYSPSGTSTDGYSAHIVVNGDSSTINYNYVLNNNNAWYAAISVTPGSVYTWSATIETCGGGQTINGEYTSQSMDVQVLIIVIMILKLQWMMVHVFMLMKDLIVLVTVYQVNY